MNGPHDRLERELADWLADGPTSGPEAALTTALERARIVRQRSAWIAALGSPDLKPRGPTSRRTQGSAFVAIAIVLVGLLLGAAALAAIGGARQDSGPVVAPTPSKSPSASRAPATPSPSPRPVPTPTLYRSDALGFEAIQPLDIGPWGNFLYAPVQEAIHALTFPDGSFVGGDVFTHFIVVSTGTAQDGAVVDITPGRAPSGATAAPDDSLVRVWAPTLDALATAYIDAAGGRRDPVAMVVDGEPAVRIIRPTDFAEAILVLHEGRAYVLSTTGFLGPSRAPTFAAFVASFRFLDDTGSTVP